ncbi:hypothetical protein [Thomasclavelia cocleata]|uniref:hypothetical protein n=1 Tax=Thomasclavelia cocleata TaxID=69824 RepID=UPI00242D0B2E|nr:hypothetical protein [Thomasclavelia cocleata]
MIEIQRKTDLLFCPRYSDGYTTKHTFPSKILKYMCVEDPILCNKLEGISEKYVRYLNYSKSESKMDWSFAIEDILTKNSDICKSKLAKKDFIKKYGINSVKR